MIKHSSYFFKYFIQKKLISRISNHLYQCPSNDERPLHLTEISAMAQITAHPDSRRVWVGSASPELLTDAQGKSKKGPSGCENPIQATFYFEKTGFLCATHTSGRWRQGKDNYFLVESRRCSETIIHCIFNLTFWVFARSEITRLRKKKQERTFLWLFPPSGVEHLPLATIFVSSLISVDKFGGCWWS